MKHALLPLLFCCSLLQLSAQYKLDWVNTPDIENFQQQYISDMEVDDEGFIFTYQNTHWYSPSFYSSGSFKGIVKQDRYGNVVWKRKLGDLWRSEHQFSKLLFQKNGFLYATTYENDTLKLFKVNKGNGNVDTVFAAYAYRSGNNKLRIFEGYNHHLYVSVRTATNPPLAALYEVNEMDSLIGVVNINNIPSFQIGEVFFTDYEGNIYTQYTTYINSDHIVHLRKMDRTGVLIKDTTVGTEVYCAILAIDSGGNTIFWSEQEGLKKLDPDFNTIWSYPVSEEPYYHAFDQNGNFYFLITNSPSFKCVKLKPDGSVIYNYDFTPSWFPDFGFHVSPGGRLIITGLSYLGLSDPWYRSHKQIAWVIDLDTAGNIKETFSDTIFYNMHNATPNLCTSVSRNGDVYMASSFYNAGIYPYLNTDSALATTMKRSAWYTLKICKRCGVDNILGRAVIDTLQNCLADSLEPPAINTMVQIKPGTRMAIVNSRGDYKFSNVGSGNYTLELKAPSYLMTNCDSEYTFTLAPNDTGVEHDFQLSPQNGCKMFLGISGTRARSGTLQQTNISFYNEAWQPLEGWLTITSDNHLNFDHSSIPPDSVDGRTYFWKYSGLAALQQMELQLYYAVEILNTSVSTYFHINTAFYSTCIGGNVLASDSLIDVVYSSFDPNDKQVFPLEVRQHEQFIDKTVPIVYQINFQNTGNDTAFRVVLRDTIDTNLDMSTFKMIGASHAYKFEAGPNRDVVWTFDNIQLLPSSFSETLSQGYVKFSITPNSSLVYGNRINNGGYIYFDFNNAILTNNVNLEYVDHFTSIANTEGDDLPKVLLYPNPTNDNLILESNQDINEIYIFNSTGSKVKEIKDARHYFKANGKYYLSVSDLSQGIYIAQVVNKTSSIKIKWGKF